jgi:adenylosuccinate lyase
MIGRYTSLKWVASGATTGSTKTWLQVEIAAAEAMARAGIVPAEAARDIRERGRFDVERIEEIEQVTQHDVIAFTTAVAEHVGPSARWLHFRPHLVGRRRYGAGAADARCLRSRSQGPRRLMQAVRTRAEEHRRTVMIGRTHGVHAEPMTFGLKLALWYAELAAMCARASRSRNGVRWEAVRRRRYIRASAPGHRGRRLPDPRSEPAPVASQVIQRDRHAELLAMLAIAARRSRSLRSRFAAAEDRNRRGRGAIRQGQKGSSAMPHKRNPDRMRADRRPRPAGAGKRGAAFEEQRALA